MPDDPRHRASVACRKHRSCPAGSPRAGRSYLESGNKRTPGSFSAPGRQARKTCASSQACGAGISIRRRVGEGKGSLWMLSQAKQMPTLRRLIRAGWGWRSRKPCRSRNPTPRPNEEDSSWPVNGPPPGQPPTSGSMAELPSVATRHEQSLRISLNRDRAVTSRPSPGVVAPDTRVSSVDCRNGRRNTIAGLPALSDQSKSNDTRPKRKS